MGGETRFKSGGVCIFGRELAGYKRGLLRKAVRGDNLGNLMNTETNPPEKKGTAQDAQIDLMGHLLGTMLDDNRNREKSQRREMWFKRTTMALVAMASIGGYFFVLNQMQGVGAIATEGPTLAVVQVRGAITSDSPLTSGGRVSAAIMEAAKDDNVKQIVLYIESPGGAPVEAERIADTVHLVRGQYKKPVTAVIGGLGASAGYMVAVAADQIVSGKYSLVGSIGAVISSWQVEGLLNKFDVRARSFVSGDLKEMLNPMEPATEKADRKAQELVDTLGGQFADLVAERRGSKLTMPIAAYTSGEVWNGEEALKLGLVDSNGTLEGFAATMPDLKVVNFGPFEHKSVMAKLAGAVESGVVQGMKTMGNGAQLEIR